MIVTGIKSGQHCTICQVPPDERENLEKKWPNQTHAKTKDQIRRQRQTNISKIGEQWVHDLNNFAWDHYLVNIHETMMIDSLHQLLKGMTMYLIN